MTFKTITNPLPNEIVQIHLQAFEGFFLTSLGAAFLEVYYKATLNSKNGLIVVALNEQNTIIGFAQGTVLSAGFHKELLVNNIFKFLFSIRYLILKKPLVLMHLYKNLRKKSPLAHDKGNYAELLSFAIHPDHKGKGIGKSLILAFENAIKNNGATELTLTTDYSANDNVVSFYKNMDYNVFYEFVTYPNRKMYKFIKRL